MLKLAGKYCPSCKEFRPEEEFTKNKRQPDGFQTHCRACHNAKAKEYRQANLEQHRLYHKAYYDSPSGKYHILTARAHRESKQVSFACDVFCDWYSQQEQVCYYCGQTLIERGKMPENLTIDRRNNNEGYTLGNIVLACRRCNTTKGCSLNERQMLQIAGLYFGGQNKELAIVDREASILMIPFDPDTTMYHEIRSFVEAMLKAGWVKEVKE